MDDLDRLIIEALQQEGRVPFTQIAQQGGVSETTVRTRYQRLASAGTIRVLAVVDPSALDYEATAVVAVSTEPGLADQIARKVNLVPEVSHLVTTLGSYDLILEVYCRDLAHLTNVVTQQIQQIPGVQTTETLVIAQSYKLACDWSPFPEPEVRG